MSEAKIISKLFRVATREAIKNLQKGEELHKISIYELSSPCGSALFGITVADKDGKEYVKEIPVKVNVK